MIIENFEGQAYQGGAAEFHGLAAHQDQARTPLEQSEIATIKYWVRNTATDALTKEGVELTVADVISDELDDFNKNFHVPFPHDCFPDAVRYEVTFEFTASDEAGTKTYEKGYITAEPIDLSASP